MVAKLVKEFDSGKFYLGDLRGRHNTPGVFRVRVTLVKVAGGHTIMWHNKETEKVKIEEDNLKNILIPKFEKLLREDIIELTQEQ